MAEQVVGQADARSPAGGEVIFVGAVIAGGVETGHVKFLHATTVDEGILVIGGQIQIKIADMASVIFEGAQLFHSQPQIQSKVGTNFPIVLGEDGEIVGAIFVIENTAAAETRSRCALQKILEVGKAADAGISAGGR
jgi:hypothetical protein